jgi:alkanesulfonate monooxygenase SsuD/methylene tetrahydromethanopterin reductase-like flavin-dependent oxidoreductase (luciferase family)
MKQDVKYFREHSRQQTDRLSGMSINFGLTLPQRGAFIGLGSISDILSLAPRAEETGLFSSVWVGDSITAKPRPESVALLGALAGMTEKLRLGVGCMASFSVRDPALFAYQWATLDLISEGRMDLAACTGIVAADGASRAEGRHFGGGTHGGKHAALPFVVVR